MIQNIQKNILLVFILSYNFMTYGQDNNWTFDRLKQEYQVNRFYKDIFKNPALMLGNGKYNVSEFKAIYSSIDEEANRIQKPNKQNGLRLLASSFYPTDSTTTLWGKAGYVNSNQKNIVWNESIDYDVIYPYFTADSVGGNLKNESYNFLGGYAKSFTKVDFGAQMSYNATLASRSRDPRVRNISSNLELKLGMNLKGFLGSSLGIYGGYQKYTQSNNISFFSRISTPAVYHLNGLGYFNNLLRGTNLRSFYEGSGYGVGLVSAPTKSRDMWLTVDFDQLTIAKFLVETLSTQVSNLKNQNLNVNLTKLFYTDKNVYGVKLNYIHNTRKGIESVISARSGAGLSVIAQNENYNLRNTVFGISGVFYRDNKTNLFSISPYAKYQKYREDYLLIRSFQYFDYLDKGVELRYVKSIDNSSAFICGVNFNYRTVLSEEALLRNDSEESLSNMLLLNNRLLASNFFETKIELEVNKKIKENLNFFIGLDANLITINENVNNSIVLTTGVRF
ncbi:DUF6850 family outer membrane beta-barrel protein [Tenacibaculum agarivorans]|uniref:DUF6850 family outer membrane beta-barrel protein n=1 Tax=Tenacibaculum agarivorans TaxID=1908389 RepID=UPI00117CBE95|nr:DUF6850 family outer membrane beta-barrel protein [Tenacibaculum agarivorans]